MPKTAGNLLVLSARPRAYESRSDDQLGEIPADVPVTRAFVPDTSRNLALRGSYPAGWRYRIDSSHGGSARPDAIWSTYPIATAHLIGLTLHRLTGLPWVADFHDSIVEEG